ncbi:ABC transporter substrate-binding protein (plasmid) [Sinorhizobium alkalisoli]|nr:ABC transporter substrate-binding protein [Sinorhizobium alkalisoli]
MREALNYAFDFQAVEFEQAKSSATHYQRINSFFFGTNLASSGLPEGKELEILNEVKDLVPPEVFTTPFRNSISTTSQEAYETCARRPRY